MDTPIVKLDKPHSSGFIFSCCILSHEKLTENYILSSADNDAIKVYHFNGKYVKEGIKFNGYINLLSTYYDKKEDKFLVIDANSRNIEVFDFNDLSKSYKYFKLKIDCVHSTFIIYENENNQVQLIDANMNGFIHIWDFHTTECLKSIPINTSVNGICLWDKQFLISTGKNKEIKIIYLNEGKVIRSLGGVHNKDTISVQKVSLSKSGECIITHSLDKCIKLWSF